MKIPDQAFDKVIERIGTGKPSLAKRLRGFFADLFGSKYVAYLERENIRLRLEQERLNAQWLERVNALEAMLAKQRQHPGMPSVPTSGNVKPAPAPQTTWERTLAKAIEDNARAEELDKEPPAATAKEN